MEYSILFYLFISFFFISDYCHYSKDSLFQVHAIKKINIIFNNKLIIHYTYYILKMIIV